MSVWMADVEKEIKMISLHQWGWKTFNIKTAVFTLSSPMPTVALETHIGSRSVLVILHNFFPSERGKQIFSLVWTHAKKWKVCRSISKVSVWSPWRSRGVTRDGYFSVSSANWLKSEDLFSIQCAAASPAMCVFWRGRPADTDMKHKRRDKRGKKRPGEKNSVGAGKIEKNKERETKTEGEIKGRRIIQALRTCSHTHTHTHTHTQYLRELLIVGSILQCCISVLTHHYTAIAATHTSHLL